VSAFDVLIGDWGPQEADLDGRSNEDIASASVKKSDAVLSTYCRLVIG